MNAKDAKYSVCRHIKTNGRRCQSPALTGGALCYFHRNLHRTHRPPASAESLLSTWKEETLQAFRSAGEDPLAIARAYPQQNEINFPPLEDAESVQLATSMLFQAIATGQIHFQRARILLYTLKIASINLRALAAAAKSDTDSSTIPRRIVRTAHGRALAAPSDDSDDNGVPSVPDNLHTPPKPPISAPTPPPTPASTPLLALALTPPPTSTSTAPSPAPTMLAISTQTLPTPAPTAYPTPTHTTAPSPAPTARPILAQGEALGFSQIERLRAEGPAYTNTKFNPDPPTPPLTLIQ